MCVCMRCAYKYALFEPISAAFISKTVHYKHKHCVMIFVAIDWGVRKNLSEITIIGNARVHTHTACCRTKEPIFCFALSVICITFIIIDVYCVCMYENIFRTQKYTRRTITKIRSELHECTKIYPCSDLAVPGGGYKVFHIKLALTEQHCMYERRIGKRGAVNINMFVYTAGSVSTNT